MSNKASLDLPKCVTEVYRVIEPLPPADRRRVVRAALELLGDSREADEIERTHQKECWV